MRRIAQQTGLSKSSVHRLTQAMERRDVPPESWVWETAEGRGWFTRLVVATLYPFGRKRGVSVETMREFFSRLRLDMPVGCAPGALRGVMHALEQALLETAAAWEHEGQATGELHPIIGAVDDTFLERMMLVFMDVVSGSLLCAEVAEDRSYDTWHALVKARIEALGVEGLSRVSDRATARITLAETGLECLSVPDVLHLLHKLVKSYALSMCSRLRQARQAFRQAQESLGDAEAQHAQALVEARAAEVTRWDTVPSRYRHHLERRSLTLHPWRVFDSTRQTSEAVARQLHTAIDAMEALSATHGLPVKKQALDTVRTQLVGVSALVDVWWQGVWHALQPVALPPRWTRGVEEVVLPRMYWREQGPRTRCSRRKAKRLQALTAVQNAFDTPPITQQLVPAVLAGWHAWATDQAKAFQRASSAVEGRNGSLSPMHPTHRGLPTQRYKVWTVLHTFDCRAADGTTPASRFFRLGFPDLFATVLSHVEDLPRPRKRHRIMALSG